MNNHPADRLAAIQQAREIVALRPLFIDTETTGLDEQAQVVDIAVVDWDGSTILSTLIRPTCPIPAQATAVHGITDEMVKDAPQFDEAWPLLWALFNRRTIVTFNAAYDSRLISQSIFARCGSEPINANFNYRCAMLLFSQWYGDWNPRYNSYRYQSLFTAARVAGYPAWSQHRALGDALAARAVVEWLAGQEG